MKKILSVNHSTSATDFALLLARVGIASLMLTHGIPKFIKLFSGEPIQFASVMGMSEGVSLGLAVFAEVICSVFILIGLGTRLATIPLITTMLVAVFIIHAADTIDVKESALHYLMVYIVLLFMGSGKYSVDFLLNRNIRIGNTEKAKAVYPNYAN